MRTLTQSKSFFFYIQLDSQLGRQSQKYRKRVEEYNISGARNSRTFTEERKKNQNKIENGRVESRGRKGPNPGFPGGHVG